ncbi:hypothetical protein T439DRAFT_359051 [Meredithblackwellia eburnea MCA 4105]
MTASTSPQGLLYVYSNASRKVSPERFKEFYDIHIEELTANEGILNGFRYRKLEGKAGEGENLVFYNLDSLEVLKTAQLAPKHPEKEADVTNELSMEGRQLKLVWESGSFIDGWPQPSHGVEFLSVHSCTPLDGDEALLGSLEGLKTSAGWKGTRVFELVFRQSVVNSTPNPLVGGPRYLSLTWWDRDPKIAELEMTTERVTKKDEEKWTSFRLVL